MNKTLIVAIIISLALSALAVFRNNPQNLLGTMVLTSSYYDATNSSSSVPATATTANPILSLDANRTNARVCNNSATSTVWLHQKSQSTTTGVVVNEGIPIYPAKLSSSTQVCESFPGFKGYLFGICDGTCWVNESSWK